MRVLLTLHHHLTPDAGAPGATLALGAALEGAGCSVEYFSFDRAFGEPRPEGVGRKLRFPLRTAAYLRRRARRFDVVDASTGDTWLWSSLRRPGAPAHQVLIARSHGLEHVVDQAARRAGRDGGARLSWRYPIYHGGLRLREVRRSLALADHCILLNSVDRTWARERLGIPGDRLTVMPNGVAPHFADAPDAEAPEGGPVRLAFVGAWLSRKGKTAVVDAVALLAQRRLEFSLTLLGTGSGDEEVAADFPPEARKWISVTPSYPNAQLPRLLAGREVLLFPSLSEGSSVALLEGMASGLAPVASRVGAAPDIIDPDGNGVLVEPGDAAGVADAVERLAGDRGSLLRVRRCAQETARRHRWDHVAEATVSLYERVLGAAAGRGEAR